MPWRFQGQNSPFCCELSQRLPEDCQLGILPGCNTNGEPFCRPPGHPRRLFGMPLKMEADELSPANTKSFLTRHEFLIRRLHSLSGLVPVGAYMTIHLLTNSSILASSGMFQKLVYQIHSLGPILPVIEWTFIFLPLIFHAVIGVVIVKGGLPNHGDYPRPSNLRYSLQRATGMIAFVFIFWHVFHMHGWFHADWWVETVAKPLNGKSFSPYSAASTAAKAIQQSSLVPICYAAGILSCVFHLANGIWTMGITWGLWVSPAAQRRANWISVAFGSWLALVSMGALWGFWSMDEAAIEEAIQVEDQMYEAKLASGDVDPNNHKRAESQHSDGHDDSHDESDHDHGGQGPADGEEARIVPVTPSSTLPVSTK